jgi:CheY-like chemotaxis protein
MINTSRVPERKTPEPYAPSILVADDDAETRRTFRQALEDVGYYVVEVDSGRAAWKAAQERFFDLIIVDLSMPDEDGIELIRSIRVGLPYLKVLAISGFLQGKFLRVAEKLGAAAALNKPVAEGTLVEQVCRLLEVHS